MATLVDMTTELQGWLAEQQIYAAWTQAVGALVAIFAAIAIAWTEGRRAQRAMRREEARLREQDRREIARIRTIRSSALALVSLAGVRLGVAKNLLSKSVPEGLLFAAKIHMNDLLGMEAQMMGFPYYEVADAEFADAFVQARIQVSTAAAFLRDLPEEDSKNDLAAAIVVTGDLLEQIIDQLTEIEHAMRTRIAA